MTMHLNSMRSRVLEAIRAARSGTPAELAKLLPSYTPSQVGRYLASLAEHGLIYPARTAHKTTRYFIDKTEAQAHLDANGGPYVPPELRGNTTASKTRPLRQAPAPLPPGAVVEERDGVKYTVGRPYTHDTRFQFPPGTKRLPAELEGAGFVADWNQRRRSTSTPKKESASC